MTAQFRFAVRDAQGAERRGMLAAENAADARRRLEGRGWTPLRVEPAVLTPPAAPVVEEVAPRRRARTLRRALLLLVLLAVVAWATANQLRGLLQQLQDALR